jgi:SAM-dependent methyltransferase
MSGDVRPEPRSDLERAAKVYLNPTPDRLVDNKLMEMTADFVISKLSGSRILELGVGEQIWTPRLVAQFSEIVSLDGSSELLERMRSRITHVHGAGSWEPVHTYFEDYRAERPFDTVIATYVLEHVDDPALILRLVHDNWLKAGGTLVVTVPHALSLHRRLAAKMGLCERPDQLGETDRLLGHKHCFTYQSMRQIIGQAGFRVYEQFGMLTKVFPNSLLVNCTDQQLRGLFDLGLELPIEYSAAIGFLARSA